MYAAKETRQVEFVFPVGVYWEKIRCIVKISRSVNKKTDVGSRNDKGHARNSTEFPFCQLYSRKENGAPLFGEWPISY